MKWFMRKKPAAQPPEVQLRDQEGHPFGALDRYVPLRRGELELYRAIREAVPIVDAALMKLVRLCGGVQVRCGAGGAQAGLERFLQEVDTGRGQRGLQSFLDQYLDSMLTCGQGVGEMVLDREGRDIAALLCADPGQIEIREGETPLEFQLCARGRNGQPVELPWQELTVLLDSIHDGIWVIDSDGITLRVNKAMERIAGLRAEEVIGKHVTEPMHKGRFETCVTLRALIEKRSVTMFDDYSNGKRCLNTSTPIFDEKGNVWRVIASIRDMTELETLQRKLTDLEMETLAYKARLENLETEMDAGFVGHSAPMRRLRKEASKAARTEAITLILGETGTGKTLTAKAIHDMGQRSAEPFIAVNCGAIPMSLMESELFGYEKGAFTGAAKSGKPGMFELAHKGTLLLDEIGELPLPMQAKLLQVLDGHPFHRVGGTKPITVDVRVIAATNRDLQKCVTEGTFREDLYYRLNVVALTLPPLRDRREDIPLLAMHFLKLFAQRNGKTVKGFTPTAMDRLLKHSWPGNVRELENAVERAVVLLVGDYVSERELPPTLIAAEDPTRTATRPDFAHMTLEEIERLAVQDTLEQVGGNKSEAARRLGINRKTLLAKLGK